MIAMIILTNIDYSFQGKYDNNHVYNINSKILVDKKYKHFFTHLLALTHLYYYNIKNG